MVSTATAKKGAIHPGTDENVVNLDFRNLTPRSGGRGAHVPAGDYLLEIVSAKNVNVKGKTDRQISVQQRIVGTPNYAKAREGIGQTVYTNLQVMPDSKGLWFTRNYLEDLLGKEITGKAATLTLSEHIGKRIGATLQDGKPFVPKNSESGDEETRSEVAGTFPASRFVGYNPATGEAGGDDEDAEDEEEAPPAPAPKARANGRAPAQAAEAAVEAVTASSDDEDDLDIEELENI
jgi:hypothetical protein